MSSERDVTITMPRRASWPRVGPFALRNRSRYRPIAPSRIGFSTKRYDSAASPNVSWMLSDKEVKTSAACQASFQSVARPSTNATFTEGQ